jgi:formylglycine-generating enzyme required for sulfatase activity
MAVTRKANARYVIPSEDEWYKAAYHKNDGVTGNYWDYPTGTDSAPGRDMTETTNPGNNANYYTSPWVWPIDSGTYYTTTVGEFQLSDSPYGTFDQGGNVMEWNEAVLDSSARYQRGGTFDTIGSFLRAASRSSYPPTAESYNFGFRVAYVPEPCSAGLLLCGGLALVRRRFRR